MPEGITRVSLLEKRTTGQGAGNRDVLIYNYRRNLNEAYEGTDA
ncbi:MAG: hypothetical protein ACOCZ3_02485 [Bacillota bacterium]